MTENPLKAESKAAILQLIRPFQAFAARETGGGIVLLASTLLALRLANSPWADIYQQFWTPSLPSVSATICSAGTSTFG